jgi:hypothetical protein
MIGQCIANHLDIFCMGVVLGAVAIKAAEWSVKFLDLWLGNNQKKLDIELGKALIKMKDKLDEQQ